MITYHYNRRGNLSLTRGSHDAHKKELEVGIGISSLETIMQRIVDWYFDDYCHE